MKNTKTKGLLLGLAMVASVASVGYASWVITSGSQQYQSGNITAETVTEKTITISQPTFTGEIHFGHDKTATPPAWLKVDGQTKDLNLKTTIKFTVTNISKGDTVTIGDLVESTSGKTPYADALKAGVVGDLPKGTTLTCDGSTLTGTGATVKANTSAGYDVEYTFTFTWGSAFNNQSPESFYSTYKTMDSAIDTTTAGAHAKEKLTALQTMNNAKPTFKCTVKAEAGTTPAA